MIAWIYSSTGYSNATLRGKPALRSYIDRNVTVAATLGFHRAVMAAGGSRQQYMMVCPLLSG
jgi:hypothetical protein